MKDARGIVGDFFEKKIMNIFDLIRTDVNALGHVPDLMSKDGSFFVEVKASAYDNGGVINKTQLFRFDKEINIRRFYAFPYHSINKHMQIYYPTEKELRNALDLRSLYLFPFSIVKAYFEKSKKRIHPKHDDFVQLDEKSSKRIFQEDLQLWRFLDLDKDKYVLTELHERIKLTTREGYLEQQIKNSFHSEFI